MKLKPNHPSFDVALDLEVGDRIRWPADAPKGHEGVIVARSLGQAGLIGDQGQKLARVLQDLVGVIQLCGELVFDAAPFAQGELVDLHQGVHIVSIARVRGDAARTRVDLLEIAHLF